MTKACFSARVPQTCGVGVIGIFRDENEDSTYATHNTPLVKTIPNPGGCDWLLVGFTNERPAYKKAYQELMQRYGQPIYQSPVRYNKNSTNKFFFCIWDTKGKK
jgi:hypothetical protein